MPRRAKTGRPRPTTKPPAAFLSEPISQLHQNQARRLAIQRIRKQRSETSSVRIAILEAAAAIHDVQIRQRLQFVPIANLQTDLTNAQVVYGSGIGQQVSARTE